MPQKKAALMVVVATLVLAVVFPVARGAAHVSCTQEHEPNNGPVGALTVQAPFCLKGKMLGKDQDMLAWTVSQTASAHPWRLMLAGIPGALTRLDIFTVKFTHDGKGIADYSSIYSLTDRGNGHANTDVIMLRPGQYFLGLSHAGGGGTYRLNVAPVSGKAQSEVEPNDTDKQAQSLVSGFEVAGNLKGSDDRYRWALSAADAGKHWRLVLRTPLGNDAWIKLYDSKGNMLGERDSRDADHGRVVFDKLGLAVGSYIIRVGPGQDADTAYWFTAEPGGPRIAGQEDEPDDSAPNTARSMAGQTHWQGAMGPDDPADVYTIMVPQAWRSKRVYITLRPLDRNHAYHLSLNDAKGKITNIDGTGVLRLADLALAPGKYRLKISGTPGPYNVQLSARTPGLFDEGEPNGTDALARHMGLVARGRFERGKDGGDTDIWQFTTQGPVQFWAIHASGDNLSDLTYQGGVWFDASAGRTFISHSLSLGPLLLAPGKHYIKINGTSGPYVLTRRALGPPRPDMEVEPNNSSKTAQSLVFGQPVNGLLSSADKDIYRFSLPSAMHIHLTVRNLSADGRFDAELFHADAADSEVAEQQLDPGGDFNWNGVLPAGDYTVGLRTPSRATAPTYRIELTRLDPFVLPRDREINDSTKAAAPLPPDRILKGGFPFNADDADFYRLPVQPVPAKIIVAPVKGGDRVNAALVDNQGYAGKPLPLKWDDKSHRYEGTIPAKTQTYLRLPNSRYHLQVTLNPDPQGGPVMGALPVTLKAALKLYRVAAFRPVAQRIRGQILVKNTGRTVEQLTLEGKADAYVGHIGAQGWRITFERPRLTLAAGASQTVAFTVEVSPDSYTDKRVPVTLAVQDPAGRVASATVGVVVDPIALPVAPHPWNALPVALLGGVDVSRPAFGAHLLVGKGGDSDRVKKRVSWHDDMVNARDEEDRDMVNRPPHGAPLVLPVALAGSAPAPVAGLVITPAFYVTRGFWLRDFELQLSADGKIWNTVLRDHMTRALHQQSFVLSHPVNARYARLRLLSNYGYQDYGYYADNGDFALGDWKVVARPGFDPTAGKGFNLAAPAAGGHLVWADPVLDGGDNAGDLFSEKPDSARADIRPAKGRKTGALAWVVGFHDDRAAQVSAFEWVRAPKSAEGHRLKKLSVSVSTDSPLGPWRNVGTWNLGVSGTAIWHLQKPVWARFVRFSANGLTPGETVLAATLRIRERPASPDYFSVLGEWGLYGSEAFFERKVHAPVPQQVSTNNTSRARALALAPAEQVTGHVRINKRVEWYRVSVPKADNELDITLRGHPSVAVRPVVLDAEGQSVPVTCKDTGPQTRHCTARVAPGRHDVRVQEPRRSVVFAWDTSSSVGAYGPEIYRALRHYSLGLDPKTEALNFLPYGRGHLLEPAWLVHPLQAFSALHTYAGGDDSSNSYTALKISANGLSKREGARAVVVMTDAETGDYDSDAQDMWRTFAKTPIRVFAVLLPSGELVSAPVADREYMQDWAATDGGVMTYATAQWEIDAAFARASAWLRRPKAYTLAYTTSHVAPPKPGSIRVVAIPRRKGAKGSGVAMSNGAVGLILDASGSMWTRIDGIPRIVAARNALQRIVTDVIPTGTPVALRVFGDQAARSCKQALEVPLAPLTSERKKRIIRVIKAVNPKLRSKTPIAASLQRMATHDLAGAKGHRLIVLVTDGHETCGGDPEATIRALEKQGIKVRLNIVGLAIADKAVKRQFRLWAKLGGGAYFDASNVKALRQGVRNALRVPFQVLSASGKVVASGFVGGHAVSVSAGDYRVEIQTRPRRKVDVQVSSGRTVKVRAQSPVGPLH